MNLKHTYGSEDDTLTRCEEFGGKAEACAKIAERLDEKLTEQEDEIERQNKEILGYHAKIETLEERIAELEADLEEAALREAARGEG